MFRKIKQIIMRNAKFQENKTKYVDIFKFQKNEAGWKC